MACGLIPGSLFWKHLTSLNLPFLLLKSLKMFSELMALVGIFQLLNLLDKNMRDLDGKLQEAENYSNQWKPVSIDIVQDQSENMKVLTIVILMFFVLDSSIEDRRIKVLPQLTILISSLAFPHTRLAIPRNVR
jgi:hypothetical protein